MKKFAIILFCIGVLINVINVNSFIRKFLVFKNGVKIKGVILNKEIIDGFETDIATYTFSCKYKDSNYIIKENLTKTDHKKFDSLTFCFYPDNLNYPIYILDNKFNKGEYFAFLIGLLLKLFGVYFFYKKY